jgi:hypothetical protein
MVMTGRTVVKTSGHQVYTTICDRFLDEVFPNIQDISMAGLTPKPLCADNLL